MVFFYFWESFLELLVMKFTKLKFAKLKNLHSYVCIYIIVKKKKKTYCTFRCIHNFYFSGNVVKCYTMSVQEIWKKTLIKNKFVFIYKFFFSFLQKANSKITKIKIIIYHLLIYKL